MELPYAPYAAGPEYDETEPDPMIDCVLAKCRRAGWVKEYAFRKGQGYVIQWSAEGEQRSILLQSMIRDKELTCRTKAKHFTRHTLGSHHAPEHHEYEITRMWRSCLQELGMGNEENSLAAMISIVSRCPIGKQPSVRIISPV